MMQETLCVRIRVLTRLLGDIFQEIYEEIYFLSFLYFYRKREQKR
jgi:hypothetical protein